MDHNISTQYKKLPKFTRKQTLLSTSFVLIFLSFTVIRASILCLKEMYMENMCTHNNAFRRDTDRIILIIRCGGTVQNFYLRYLSFIGIHNIHVYTSNK
jgi:hypothetical protein